MLRRELLDHGYIELVETWGSDERIIEAARMSTDKGFQGWGPKPCPRHCQSDVRLPGGGYASNVPQRDCPACKGEGAVPGDEKLLRYLWEHKHHTPFEMSGLTLEVQAPIFVFREWHRHRTQSYNELSARYTVLPDLFYVPSLERIMMGGQGHANKQGSGVPIGEAVARRMQAAMEESYKRCRELYEKLILDNLARELARTVIPFAQYSRMRASANLRNWLAFLTLRKDPAAQWEIRQYANVVGEMISKRFPRTWTLFAEGL